MQRSITASEARDEFADVINRVAYGGERVVIRRREKELAAVIPMEDLRLLERLIEQEEDRLDAEAARKALADSDDEAVPWEEARKELGL
ncbi:MAG TPA: type II toxin-antitoxin system Phd/YefM family antitoxin [Rubrobacteraceae bacterium]|nr:type II toxin-antitoxin system Phd/YefM family antitoxin [Rubrobacteraceae bacterium]